MCLCVWGEREGYVYMYDPRPVLVQLAGMARTPYPLLDPIMVGPVLLCLNIHFPVLPDLLLLLLVTVSLVVNCCESASTSRHTCTCSCSWH